MNKEKAYNDAMEEIRIKYSSNDFLMSELLLIENEIQTSISLLPATRYFRFNTV